MTVSDDDGNGIDGDDQAGLVKKKPSKTQLIVITMKMMMITIMAMITMTKIMTTTLTMVDFQRDRGLCLLRPTLPS